jgi:heptosyltransferase-1
VRILFVKTSSLGDVVHNCPAVSEAARRNPGARIDWIVEEPFAAVAALHASVEHVIPIAVRRWHGALFSPRTWSEFGAFRAALRRERYDCVIDTQGLLKSALITALAQGDTHGYDRASAREPVAARFYLHRHEVTQALHAVERNRKLTAVALGYAVEGDCDYGLRVAGAVPEPRALLFTMTSRADKLWPEEHWRALGAGLAAHGLQCVLPWGNEEERRRCARIAAAIKDAVVPPHMALGELAAQIARARCVAGVDTGLTHVAAALGVPVLGIYCGSDPALTGLYGSARARNVGSAGRPPSPMEALAALGNLA